jgi:hypothetical protein
MMDRPHSRIHDPALDVFASLLIFLYDLVLVVSLFRRETACFVARQKIFKVLVHVRRGNQLSPFNILFIYVFQCSNLLSLQPQAPRKDELGMQDHMTPMMGLGRRMQGERPSNTLQEWTAVNAEILCLVYIYCPSRLPYNRASLYPIANVLPRYPRRPPSNPSQPAYGTVPAWHASSFAVERTARSGWPRRPRVPPSTHPCRLA